jgi:Ca2+-binding RTX toxin-like protein
MIGVALGAIVISLVAPTEAGAGTPRCFGRPATIVGTGASETLRGTPRADVIVGLGGGDLLDGRGGNDLICGNGGADVLLGGAGSDKLSGGAANDELVGGRGTDTCDQNAGTGPVASCELPEPELDLDGTWSGTTSQGRAMSFQVQDHAVQPSFSFSFTWTGPGCTATGTITNIVASFAIQGDQFPTFNLMMQGATFHSDSGVFASETQASGEWSAESAPGFGCPGSVSGTWTATKQ